jgi:hypothetical protein
MWILLMVTVTGPISIPGYATREACEAANKHGAGVISALPTLAKSSLYHL